MEVNTLAIGVRLSFVPAEAGGRHTGLRGGFAAPERFTYRPNWGLPGWADGEQTAAPVLGFSETGIEPGDQTKAILVPLFVVEVPAWRSVTVGDSLRMYEGSRICGTAEVLWLEPTTWFMPEEEQDRLAQWLGDSA